MKGRRLRGSLLALAGCAAAAWGDTRPPIDIPGLREAQAHDAAIVALDGQLRRGEWAPAREAALSLLERSKSTFHGSTQRALVRLVVAEARLGHEEEALWQLQALGAMGGVSLLEPLLPFAGPAREKLETLPIRIWDEAPPGVAGLGARAGSTPARRKSGEAPLGNAGCASARGPLWARFQAVIDAQGRLTRPVIEGPSVCYSYEILRASRSWTFEPARREGAPVAALYAETFNPVRGKKLRELAAPGRGVSEIVSRLESGRFAEAEAKIEKLWNAALDAGSPSRPETVTLLALRAIALAAHDDPSDQRRAICLWEAAQGEEPDFYHLDLAALGAAGKLLSPHRFGEVRLHPGGAAGEDAPPGVRIERPEVIRESRRAPRARFPADSYSTSRVFIEAIVDDQGALREPILIDRPDGMRGLDLEALDAVCAWRFRPATRGGKPLGVLYVLTLGV